MAGSNLNLKVKVSVDNLADFKQISKEAKIQEKSFKSINFQLDKYSKAMKALQSVKLPKVPEPKIPKINDNVSKVIKASKKQTEEYKKQKKIKFDLNTQELIDLRAKKEAARAEGRIFDALKAKQEITKETFKILKAEKDLQHDLVAAHIKEENILRAKKKYTDNKRETNDKLRVLRQEMKIARESNDIYNIQRIKLEQIYEMKKKSISMDKLVDSNGNYNEEQYNKELKILKEQLDIKKKLNKYNNDIRKNDTGGNETTNLDVGAIGRLKAFAAGNKKATAALREYYTLQRVVLGTFKVMRKSVYYSLIGPLKVATGFLKKFALIGASFYVGKAFAQNMIEGIAKLFEGTAMLEEARIKMEALSGSSELAAENIKFLREYSLKYAIDIGEAGTTMSKMMAYGLGKSAKELQSYYKVFADTAAATGKTVDQVSEAIVDAMQGENERLKEFAIRGRTVGDNIVYTFKNIKGELINVMANKYDPQAILDLQIRIMKDKYAGQVEAMAGTWNGLIRRMQNTWLLFVDRVVTEKGLFDNVKKSLEGLLDKLQFSLKDGKTELFDELSDWVEGAVKGIIHTLSGIVTSFLEIKKALIHLKGTWAGEKLFGKDELTSNELKQIEILKKARSDLNIWSYNDYRDYVDDYVKLSNEIYKVEHGHTQRKIDDINKQEEALNKFKKSLLDSFEDMKKGVKNTSEITSVFTQDTKEGIVDIKNEQVGVFDNFNVAIMATDGYMKRFIKNTMDGIKTVKTGLQNNAKLARVSTITKELADNKLKLSKLYETTGGYRTDAINKEVEQLELRNSMIKKELKTGNRYKSQIDAISEAKIKQLKYEKKIYDLKGNYSEKAGKVAAEIAYNTEYEALRGIYGETKAIAAAEVAREEKLKEYADRRKANAKSEIAGMNRQIGLRNKLLKLEKEQLQAQMTFADAMSGKDESDFWKKTEEQQANFIKAQEIRIEIEKRGLIESGLAQDKALLIAQERMRIFHEGIAESEKTFSNGINNYMENLNDRLADYSGMTEEFLNNTENILSNNLGKAFDAFIEGTFDAKKAFKSFAQEMLKMILQMTTKMAAMYAMQMALSAFGGGGGGFMNFFAKGGVFTDGVQAYANGGVFTDGVEKFASGGTFTNSIVSKPTNFNMGLMGEAGTEGIFPMQRDNKGVLGIKGVQPTVNMVVNNNAPGVRVVQETNSKGEHVLTIEEVEAHLVESMASGTGKFAGGLTNAYAMKRL